MAMEDNKQRDSTEQMEGRPQQNLKSVETVRAEPSWCCLARSSSMPSSPRTPSNSSKPKVSHKPSCDETSIKENHHPASNSANPVSTDSAQEAIYRKLEKKRRSGEMNRAGEVLKSGEIAALLKQGFIAGSGTLEKGSTSPFKIRVSPGRVSPLMDVSSSPVSPPSATTFSKLNSLLHSGFLSQASPPLSEKTRSSPTLFEMMVHEQELQDKFPHSSRQQLSLHFKQANPKNLSLQERILSINSPGNQFNDPASSDVKLTLISSRDDISVTVHVHSEILAAQSRFFAAKLSEVRLKQPKQAPHAVRISNCNDVEAYIDTIRLMYCHDRKRKLLKESVSRVLNILKVSASILFEAGILSCLEYLEAVPWAEEEEEKVKMLLAQLHLESVGTGEVLKRISTEDSIDSQDLLVRLLHSVIKGTDEKARREMKGLVSKMLRENVAQGKDPDDLSKDSIYRSCQECLDSLLNLFSLAINPDLPRMNEDRCMLMTNITRQADNLNWLVDILIDRQIADDFVKIWAFQGELATLHAQVPIALGRYEVSRLTARLCMAIGKGEVLAAKDVRFALLQNWLQPLIDDFGWMQRACKGLDRGLVEEGLSQTILTLPLKQQQSIMVAWFDRFLKNGDDCPNLQRAFETWWRRTFVRPQLDACLSSPAKECHLMPIHSTTFPATGKEASPPNPSLVAGASVIKVESQSLPD
ncbi:hypothetical protein KP509_05G015600 [Ceratopteris richardii]|uniref:BTB domain-containing protein n=1 Tax=Ceratopteris richardii TaxID=49495 RepID=A0A8T2UP24_CERRI|nr:hypothetical protein KP509_05G015600 [Ceratopteris richardii]KAH7436350.1 hypothetical protein KP509_05G015600 [Ceratopteris richardii]KAH7436351.1 hypothetical protein KP509_05G015600 [Ceratopteris richardii]KAH7436352.1 hypothetical protein KP509_05G015600 [Ceratopteris richardii]